MQFFKLGYCGHPQYPYSNIFLYQESDLILSHFQEHDHPFIIDALRDENIQLFSFYYIYKPKTNTPRTNITNEDENAYKHGPLYGDESTGFHRHMISVIVFSYLETLESMLVEYAATEIGFLDDYSDADPNQKIIRRNCITTFLLHVAQCIIFNQTNRVKTILIANASLKSFYSRLGLKVIKDFATSTNFEETRSRFHY